MSLLLVVAVAWVAIVCVVLGACVAASRADRAIAAVEAERAIEGAFGVVAPGAIAPLQGVMGAGLGSATRNAAVPAIARVRGAHTGRHARTLARR